MKHNTTAFKIMNQNIKALRQKPTNLIKH